MSLQDGKQIRGLMEDPRWAGVESFVEKFLMRNFVQGSVKRDTEFDTIWYAAFMEGGKHYIQQFMSELEAEARKDE